MLVLTQVYSRCSNSRRPVPCERMCMMELVLEICVVGRAHLCALVMGANLREEYWGEAYSSICRKSLPLPSSVNYFRSAIPLSGSIVRTCYSWSVFWWPCFSCREHKAFLIASACPQLLVVVWTVSFSDAFPLVLPSTQAHPIIVLFCREYRVANDFVQLSTPEISSIMACAV